MGKVNPSRFSAVYGTLVGTNHVAISSAFVGMTPSSYGTSALYVFNAGPHEAVLQVNLADDYEVESLDALKEQIRHRVRQKLPNVHEPIDLTDKIMSQGAQTPIEILVGGKDLGEGQHYANRLLEQLRRIPYLRDLRINQPLSYPTVQI